MTAAVHPPSYLPNPRAAAQLALPIALLLHLLLLALLSLQWPEEPERDENPPMEVDLIAEIAPKSTAPIISATPPPPKLGETDDESVTPPAPPPPPAKAPLPPVPVKMPTPRPEPAKTVPTKAPPPKAPPPKTPPAKAPATKAPPTKAPPAKAPPSKAPPRGPTGRLDGITDGMSKAPPTKAPPAKGVPAAQTAAEVRKSIDVAIDGKILPHWRRNVPSGLEIDQLRVVLRIRLNQDGSVAGVDQIGELTGKTESNRPQQALFVERAIRSIRQAAPFNLPAEYYDQWRVWDVTFRARGI